MTQHGLTFRSIVVFLCTALLISVAAGTAQSSAAALARSEQAAEMPSTGTVTQPSEPAQSDDDEDSAGLVALFAGALLIAGALLQWHRRRDDTQLTIS